MRQITTLLLALFFTFSASLSAQVITGATVTPNPAYSNTPVTVNVQGYLTDGCQYIANVSSAWTGRGVRGAPEFWQTDAKRAFFEGRIKETPEA